MGGSSINISKLKTSSEKFSGNFNLFYATYISSFDILILLEFPYIYTINFCMKNFCIDLLFTVFLIFD